MPIDAPRPKPDPGKMTFAADSQAAAPARAADKYLAAKKIAATSSKENQMTDH